MRAFRSTNAQRGILMHQRAMKGLTILTHTRCQQYHPKKNIILSDNLGYIYSININSGKLVWAKNYGVPFRSNIKIDDNNIFLLNQDNKFYTIKEKTGEKTLDLETFPSFLKSKLETTISLDPKNKNLYFITSSGELYSINYATRNINWLSTIFSDKALIRISLISLSINSRPF